MAISPGTRFGPYEVADEIGAGGMGVVYRATDTKLDREVAIKVLPESMASDAERIARFDREAKMLAALNHPNIAQIHGLEESDGTTALIMELIEGPTLADRIEQGALPADEALVIAMQIAEALEAAHGQNIVHRDLKPANIKLRPDGTVKVLDFGIAKALEPETVTSVPQSPVLTTPATLAGVILGTAAYMSPEQARGKPVDQRADIWAFGCVLYEMLTGQPAFGGEDIPLTLARVLDRDTDMDSLPAAISPAIRQTIKLCLQKDVRKRVADIRDVRLALEGAFDIVSPRAGAGEPVARPVWRRALPVIAPAITALVAGIAVWIALQPAPRPVNRFDFDVPADQSFRFPGWNVLTFSRDGRSIVYNTLGGLYLRTLGELEPRLISGTEENLAAPYFSPDGQSVVYGTAAGEIKRVSINGGAPITLATQIPSGNGPSWDFGDWILYSVPDGIYRLSVSGGAPELIIPPTPGEFITGQRLLSDGDYVLFSATPTGSPDDGQIIAQSISTGERKVLISGGSDARYVATGHLVYAYQDGLYAVAFDLDSLTVSGAAVPVVQGVMRSAAPTGSANFGVSDDGILVYVTGTLAADARRLVWVGRDGNEDPIAAPPRAYTSPRLSPDGTKVALSVRDQEVDIWTWDLVRGTLTRLTFDPGQDRFPAWSPDGQRIAYSAQLSTDEFNTSVVWQAANGTGAVELLAGSSGNIWTAAFLPDSTGILVYGDMTNPDDDIALVQLDGQSEARALLDTTFGEAMPEISPDGRWLAYVSNESGADEIYVRPFPDVDAGRWQVSTDGGAEPLWARNGQELFFRKGGAVMAVPIQTDPRFTAGNPELVFEGQFFEGVGAGGRSYDVSADGERFMMIRAVDDASLAPRIVIVENWLEELERLVPTE